MILRHFIFLLVVVSLMSIPAAGAVTVIQPGVDGAGYFWSGSTVSIVLPGEYRFAANLPGNTVVDVRSSEVTLDGRNVPIHRIIGQPDLDLRNIAIYVDEPNYRGPAISRCRNIVNSSIFVKSFSIPVLEFVGIGSLYGNIDDTSSITLDGSQHNYSHFYGVDTLYGTISGGTFTVANRGGEYASGVRRILDNGAISGGKFIVTGAMAMGVGGRGDHTTNHIDPTSGIHDNGSISGGEFIITGLKSETFGVTHITDDGAISGGTFTVTHTYHLRNSLYQW